MGTIYRVHCYDPATHTGRYEDFADREAAQVALEVWAEDAPAATVYLTEEATVD